MTTTMALSDLMIAVRNRADIAPSGYTPTLAANPQHISDAELITYINNSAFEFYNLLVSKFGDDYFVANPYPITTTAGADHYALPADFLKLIGVDLMVSGVPIPLKRFMNGDRGRYNFSGGGVMPPYGRGTNIHYRLSGNNLWLLPLPQAGQLVNVWYVPRMVPLAALTDTLEGLSGWTEYVIVDAAIKCMQKEESDCSLLMAQKAGIRNDIDTMAAERDLATPGRIRDVYDCGWGD